MRTLMLLFFPTLLAAQAFTVRIHLEKPMTGIFAIRHIGSNTNLFIDSVKGKDYQREVYIEELQQQEGFVPLSYEISGKGLGSVSGLMTHVPIVFSLNNTDENPHLAISNGAAGQNTWYFDLFESTDRWFAAAKNGDTAATDSLLQMILRDTMARHQEILACVAMQFIISDIFKISELPRIKKHFCSAQSDLKWVQQLCGMVNSKKENPTLIWDQIVLRDIKDQLVSIKELPVKKYILLDFWASWCGPCIQSIPELKKIQQQYSEQLSIISISIDKSLAAWQKTSAQMGLPWWSFLDNPEMKSKLEINLEIKSIPTYILLDVNKNILYRGNDYKKIHDFLR
jgi:thiol-disulfide isomerase/thioredoxin